ncbi:MAG: hypothetical protein CL834_05055 [Crocinitomicaceae bacterium]|nr:hypothetical protein [Crocinitomicaceae bacterium]
MKINQMKSRFATLLLALTSAVLVNAQSDSYSVYDPAEAMDSQEIRLNFSDVRPSEEQQAILRNQSQWNEWGLEHPKWRTIMSASTALPHRAFGPAIQVPGTDLAEKAAHFVSNDLALFGIEYDGAWITQTTSGRHQWAFAQQTIDGIPVEGGQIVTKWWNDQLVMWGADWYRDVEMPEGVELSPIALVEAASSGVQLDEWSTPELGTERLVSVPSDQGLLEWKKVQTIFINGRVGAVPRRYETWVDMNSGEVLMRQNRVVHIDGRVSMPGSDTKPERVVNRMGLDRPAEAMVISGVIKSTINEMYPYEASVELPLPMLFLPIPGGAVTTDIDGGFISNASGPQLADVELAGSWSTVYTGGITPQIEVQFEDGYNNLNLDALGNVKERSAYRSVVLIHEHMKEYLPNFTGLDFSLTTNVDVEGECNAFYDGISVNFFDTGGGCNPTSLIADVVWHEYGHGINDYYYGSLGAGFNNGAMNEGYADLWAMSLGDIAEIGKGFYTDNEDGIRKYDADPKVYPEDLVGEVHADGEIICGAWYDTHLLMGGDWDATMALFIDAYPGLQATVQNGNEGQAYTDVLIDALQADDDDGDLSNGTPNAAAIVEGFDIHGISVFSYAEIDHAPIEFAPAEEVLLIEAEADIVFPYNLYFDAVRLWYRTETGGDWSEVEMDNVEGTSSFTASIPAQDEGSVISYYMGITDDFGGIAGVTPFAAANAPYPNLPNFILVGVEPMLVNDSDEYSDFGAWTTGLPGIDNATTGIWEEAIPVGSYAELNDPSTIVAPTSDHTIGLAGYAFLTGLNPGVNDGIGANDVDAGKTTLVSPIIDMTAFENPVMTYWRWYTNAPASGANPASDWWQVEISNDGGSTWQYLENTLQQDISWRRMAFNVADVIELTDAFQMRFIASDSTTVGEYLDGGSLIEAALDDIILYDLAETQNVAFDAQSDPQVSGFPNPTRNGSTTKGWMPGSTVRVFSAVSGQLVHECRANGSGQCLLPASAWKNGLYEVTGWSRSGVSAQWTLEVLR